VAGATAYDVFVLGEKYMDSVGTTVNTFFEPRIRYQEENWFSVRARGDSGILGRRAIAVSQTAGSLLNCAGVAPTAAFAIDTIRCDSQWVFLQDQSLKSPDAWQWTISPDVGIRFIQQTSDSSRHPVISFADTGTYRVSLRTINQFGSDSSSQLLRIRSCNTSLPLRSRPSPSGSSPTPTGAPFSCGSQAGCPEPTA
jgi:PKD repeat protein